MINTTGRYTDDELMALYRKLYDNLWAVMWVGAGPEVDRVLDEEFGREIPLPNGDTFATGEFDDAVNDVILEFMCDYLAELQRWLLVRTYHDVGRRAAKLRRARESAL